MSVLAANSLAKTRGTHCFCLAPCEIELTAEDRLLGSWGAQAGPRALTGPPAPTGVRGMLGRGPWTELREQA